MKIVNISSLLELNNKVDIEKLRNENNAKFKPNGFNALVIKFEDFTASIFEKGKVVLTGTKNLKHTKEKSEFLVNWLNEKSNNVKEVKTSIQNIVGSGKKREIDLKKFYEFLRKNSKIYDVIPFYEPEQFPGLRIAFLKNKKSILIFRSGKYILTCVKNLKALHFLEMCLNFYVKSIFE